MSRRKLGEKAGMNEYFVSIGGFKKRIKCRKCGRMQVVDTMVRELFRRSWGDIVTGKQIGRAHV